jgi:hypothetical protein
MKITITGASDDLIEIDGDFREEFSVNMETAERKGGLLLAVSDGTLLRVRYNDDGIWRITRIVNGMAKFSKTEGDVAADTFDVVTLEGELVNWVVLGIDVAMTGRRAR